MNIQDNRVKSDQLNRLPPTMDEQENHHFYQRFDRLEQNVEQITKAMVEIAKIEARQAGMTDLIAQQSAMISQLSTDVRDGLKRSHERTDGVMTRLAGFDVFIQQAAPKINEIEALKMSTQDMNSMRRNIDILLGWRNKIAGGLMAVAVVMGLIQWFAVKEYDRIEDSAKQQEATIRQMAIEIDRLNRAKP